eukprot:evm.model.scf_13EXC.18 EVM.evm.TU.scf_13EXC.18   scf_13EXC:215356-219713(+)
MDWIRSRALNAVTWALKEGYVFDYVLLIVLMVLNFGVAVEVVEPKERFFIPGDPTLSYPKQDDKMVPSWLLVLVAGAGPLGIFAMWQLRMRSWVDWHHSSLSAAEAFALASTWKRWMNLVGRLRPDWMERWESGNADDIAAGRLAYPSGHTAYSFATMTVVAWYLVGKLDLFHATHRGQFVVGVVPLIPVGIASYIGLSRTLDYVHDFSDINAGGLIGLACGTYAYFLNYPSPFSKNCHEPRLRSRSVEIADKLAHPDDHGEQELQRSGLLPTEGAS